MSRLQKAVRDYLKGGEPAKADLGDKFPEL